MSKEEAAPGPNVLGKEKGRQGRNGGPETRFGGELLHLIRIGG